MMTSYHRLRYWLPLLPLLALLALAYWLNQQAQPEAPRKVSLGGHDPDAIMENFSATKMNDLGLPGFVMSAKKMMHYPDDDSTILEDPHISMLSADHPALHATAKRGKISSKGDEIFLYDDVKVSREASARQDLLTLQTDYLHIVPDKSLTDTNLAVTVADAHSTVQAIGLQMDSQKRILKLLSRVRSEYVPPKM
jgi:lipopolysaccharide export system protein LptC